MELKLQSPLSIGELARKLNATLGENSEAAVSKIITNIKSLESATESSISFLTDNPAYRKYLATTNAGVVVTSKKYASSCSVPCLIVSNPRLALAKILCLCQTKTTKDSSIHTSAIIGKDVHLGENVTIGPNCVIGDNCKIGNNTSLISNVSIYANTRIGDFCTIHSGTVLGSDGFGYEMDEDGKWLKLPHLGGLLIGDHVEIGSNTCIDRGMIDDTIIGDWVVIDNLVQIGHNVVIGDYTAIAGCAGIAGSTVIGKRCLIGGASSIAGHITIADKVYISGTTSVSHSLLESGIYSSGLPARENSAWRRSVARFNTIDNMAKRLRALERHVRNSDNVAICDDNISDSLDENRT